jgi:hypothetical protein
MQITASKVQVTFSSTLKGTLDAYFNHPLHSRTPLRFNVGPDVHYFPDHRDTAMLTAILGNLLPFEHERSRGVEDIRVTSRGLLVTFNAGTSFNEIKDYILDAVSQFDEDYDYNDVVRFEA